MPASPTVADLFHVAIIAERTAEEMYRRLAKKFKHVAPFLRFMELYASEEAGHAVWLDSLLRKVLPEKLAAPAIPTLYSDALALSEIKVVEELDKVSTLEDAYTLIYELEHGELNQVLDFLITTYYEDTKTQVFLRELLRQHIERIEYDFPDEYGTSEARLRVAAAL